MLQLRPSFEEQLLGIERVLRNRVLPGKRRAALEQKANTLRKLLRGNDSQDHRWLD